MKPSADVVFITYDGLPGGDPDDLLALSILQSQGLQVTVLDWRKMETTAIDCGVAVLRSTWDYHHYFGDFLQWIDAAASQFLLQNTADLVRWNANKKYLLDLAAHGVAIVPTQVLGATAAEAMTYEKLSRLLISNALSTDGEVIVKPAVGLATAGVKKFRLSGEDSASMVAHIKTLGKRGDVLIQPYLEEVEKYGERSLIYIDGNYSHSVRKAAFQKLAAAGEAGEKSVKASADEIAFGLDVLQKLKAIKGCADPLYARVDIVPDSQGRLFLLELELIEPSLFLGMAEGAAERFAAAIGAKL